MTDDYTALDLITALENAQKKHGDLVIKNKNASIDLVTEDGNKLLTVNPEGFEVLKDEDTS
ncbi:hypothetical protein OSG_eHP23_00165 [environmental Halophage eHP-23]|nr:hypothetical protein OSG_eHP23_00165 [environmental Halophage eHP-23]